MQDTFCVRPRVILSTACATGTSVLTTLQVRRLRQRESGVGGGGVKCRQSGPRVCRFTLFRLPPLCVGKVRPRKEGPAPQSPVQTRDLNPALAGVAQWIECRPADRGVAGLIPSQGTCLGCGPGPQLGRERQPIAISLLLFLPPFPSL